MKYKSPESYMDDTSNEIGLCMSEQKFKSIDVIRNYHRISKLVDEIAMVRLCNDRLKSWDDSQNIKITSCEVEK